MTVAATSTVTGRSLPGYAWLGLLVMSASEAGMLAGIEPFASWHTPIAWTGYILFVDGFVWKRRGHSWIRNARPEFLFLAAVSIPLWLVFEIYKMPILGFGGFPAFAVECFVMYVALRRWTWTGARRAIGL